MNISADIYPISSDTASVLKKRFIAFDVETTGFDNINDRIIELGAVIFESGAPLKVFSSLVHSVDHVPGPASSVNHITDSMIQHAPSEEEVYAAFTDFLGDALQGETYLCAHNAPFDMSFLQNTLDRLGYFGTLKFVDTLTLSRKLLPDISHKQDSLACYFGFVNRCSHRASSDAEVCGKIMLNLLQIL